MATESVNQLREIRNKIQNLSIDDQRAREFEGLVQQSIGIISELKNTQDDFFETRRRTALRGLQGELDKYLQGYWQQNDRIDKISQFSRARNHAQEVLSNILASFKR